MASTGTTFPDHGAAGCNLLLLAMKLATSQDMVQRSAVANSARFSIDSLIMLTQQLHSSMFLESHVLPANAAIGKSMP